MNALFPIPNRRVEQVTSDDLAHLRIIARGLGRGHPCPECGKAGRSIHSRYQRRPADLPSIGRTVRPRLRVRRFYCRNAACARRTFAERPPDLLAPFSRRTHRLADAQGRTGAALGGRAGAGIVTLTTVERPDAMSRYVMSIKQPYERMSPDARR